MATTNILHLSDLHFGDDRDKTGRQTRAEVLNGLIKIVTKLNPNLLVISGDLTFQGREQGYTELANWLTNKLFPATGLTPRDCLICPGNHDLDRDKSMGVTIEKAEDADLLLRPEKLDLFCAPAFHRFLKFATDFGIVPPQLQGKGNYLAGVRDFPERGLRFLCANSAWFCRDAKDQSKLWLGLPQLIAMEIDRDEYDSAPITIALVHHPPNWLNNADFISYGTRTSAYFYLAERAHLILSGHTHGLVMKPDRYSDRARLLLAGASYAKDDHRNNFSLLQIDGDRRLTRLAFEYDPGGASLESRGTSVLLTARGTGPINHAALSRRRSLPRLAPHRNQHGRPAEAHRRAVHP